MLRIETIERPAGIGNAHLVHVHGEIDTVSAPNLRTALSQVAEHGTGPVIVVLRRCPYFDSSGFAVLAAMRRALGSRLRIVVPKSSAVRRVFEVTGLSAELQVVESLGEALGGEL